MSFFFPFILFLFIILFFEFMILGDKVFIGIVEMLCVGVMTIKGGTTIWSIGREWFRPCEGRYECTLF